MPTSQDLVLEGFMEDLQDYIAANFLDGARNVTGDPVYTVGTNFTLGQSPDPTEDFPTMARSDRIRLVLYEEAATVLRSGRRPHPNRPVRFVARGDNPQDANNRCHRLVQWFENSQRHFVLPRFSCRTLGVSAAPTVAFRSQDRTALSSFVMSFLALGKVT